MTWLSQLLSAASKPFQWWVTVAPWEQALRVRLGKVACLLGPGVHFRIPFLDRVYRQSLRRRVITDTGQTVTTRDGRVLTVSIAVMYEVNDLVRLYNSIASPESVLLAEVQSRIAAFVSATDASAVRPTSITDAAAFDASEWGLKNVSLRVIGFAFVKTYRLLTNDYRSFTGLDVDTWDGQHAGAPR